MSKFLWFTSKLETTQAFSIFNLFGCESEDKSKLLVWIRPLIFLKLHYLQINVYFFPLNLIVLQYLVLKEWHRIRYLEERLYE